MWGHAGRLGRSTLSCHRDMGTRCSILFADGGRGPELTPEGRRLCGIPHREQRSNVSGSPPCDTKYLREGAKSCGVLTNVAMAQNAERIPGVHEQRDLPCSSRRNRPNFADDSPSVARESLVETSTSHVRRSNTPCPCLVRFDLDRRPRSSPQVRWVEGGPGSPRAADLRAPRSELGLILHPSSTAHPLPGDVEPQGGRRRRAAGGAPPGATGARTQGRRAPAPGRPRSPAGPICPILLR